VTKKGSVFEGASGVDERAILIKIKKGPKATEWGDGTVGATSHSRG